MKSSVDNPTPNLLGDSPVLRRGLRDLSLSDLEFFMAIDEAGGVNRAAQKLACAQSNVSKRIGHLERVLDTELFARSQKGMSLSPTGKILKNYADRFIALVAEADSAIHDGRPRGLLRVGVMEHAALPKFPQIVQRFAAQHVDVDLQLFPGNPQDLAGRVLAGSLDAAYVADLGLVKSLHAQCSLFQEKLVLIGPAGWSGEPLPVKVAFPAGCPFRRRLERWYFSCNAVPTSIYEVGSYASMLRAVALHEGVALLPEEIAEGLPGSSYVSFHEPRGLQHMDIDLICRADDQSPGLRALLQTDHAAA